jgi:hypothetical protein
MLLLAPLPGTHGFLRCIVVTTATADRDSGVVAVSAAPLPKKLPSRVSGDSEKTHQPPPNSLDATSVAAKPSLQARHGRKRPRHDRSTSPSGGPDELPAAGAVTTAKPRSAHSHQAESGLKGRKNTKVRSLRLRSGAAKMRRLIPPPVRVCISLSVNPMQFTKQPGIWALR